MKKLNLLLKGHEMLSKEQMKKIRGGSEHECPCSIECLNPDDYPLASFDGWYCDTSVADDSQTLINFCADQGYPETGHAHYYCDNAA